MFTPYYQRCAGAVDKFWEEAQMFLRGILSKESDYEQLLLDGQNLLNAAHPSAVPTLTKCLQDVEESWLTYKRRAGESLFHLSVPVICIPQ